MKIFLERLIEKVDVMEKNMKNINSEIDDVNTVVSKIKFKIENLADKVRISKCDAIQRNEVRNKNP